MATVEITPSTDATLALHFDEYMELCGDLRTWKKIQKDKKAEMLSMVFEHIIERLGEEENLFESLDDVDILDFS